MIFNRLLQVPNGPKHKKNLSTPYGQVEELKEVRRSRSDEGNSEFALR